MEDIDNLWEELKVEVGIIARKYKANKDERILIGTGNREANILFIGDDPNLYQNEDLRVAPASSGEFLIKLCDHEGLSPEDYYITTLTKKEFKYFDLFEDDKRDILELLFLQISLIKPKIIVTIGNEVTNILLEKELKIQDVHGTVIDWYGGIKVIPLYDVNFVKKSRNESGKKSKIALDFWNDLKFIKQEYDKLND